MGGRGGGNTEGIGGTGNVKGVLQGEGLLLIHVLTTLLRDSRNGSVADP